MLNICSGFIGGSVQVAYNLDRPDSLCKWICTWHRCREAEIWRRFGGGSDRNRALLGNKGYSVHGMQIAQSRINTGDCASR